MVFLVKSARFDDYEMNGDLKRKYRLDTLLIRVSSVRAWQGQPSCTYKKAVSSKKDEIYSISSFLFIKNCIKRCNSEYLFAQKVGQKCCDLELSFCHFPEHIGFELKRQLFLANFSKECLCLYRQRFRVLRIKKKLSNVAMVEYFSA